MSTRPPPLRPRGRRGAGARSAIHAPSLRRHAALRAERRLAVLRGGDAGDGDATRPLRRTTRSRRSARRRPRASRRSAPTTKASSAKGGAAKLTSAAVGDVEVAKAAFKKLLGKIMGLLTPSYEYSKASTDILGDVNQQCGYEPDDESWRTARKKIHECELLRVRERVLRDLRTMRKDGPEVGLEVEDCEVLTDWVIKVVGAPKTVYEGEIYRLRVRFHPDYPGQPPEVVFMRPAPVHEHIYSDGKICLNILYNDREPTMDVKSLCLSLLSSSLRRRRRSGRPTTTAPSMSQGQKTRTCSGSSTTTSVRDCKALRNNRRPRLNLVGALPGLLRADVSSGLETETYACHHFASVHFDAIFLYCAALTLDGSVALHHSKKSSRPPIACREPSGFSSHTKGALQPWRPANFSAFGSSFFSSST